jgi:hypothetical protein
MTYGIWLSAAVVYAIFGLWYNNLRGPLTEQEVGDCMDRLDADERPRFEPARRETLRRFLIEDDGREFFMLNLVQFHRGNVVEPESGVEKPAPKVLEGYTRPFLRALFKRAGHPVFGGRAAGGYLEHWGVEPDPDWTFGAAVRYRCRRDMIELVLDPAFADMHVFKEAAMARTFAFPIAPGFLTFGPRVVLGLLLSLVAATAHILVIAGGAVQ